MNKPYLRKLGKNIKFARKERTLHLTKVLGDTVRELRIAKTDKSMNKLEEEYDIARGNISRIESGKCDSQFSTLWKLAEALDLKFSDLAKLVEEKVGDKFKLIDE